MFAHFFSDLLGQIMQFFYSFLTSILNEKLRSLIFRLLSEEALRKKVTQNQKKLLVQFK